MMITKQTKYYNAKKTRKNMSQKEVTERIYTNNSIDIIFFMTARNYISQDVYFSLTPPPPPALVGLPD